MINWTAEIIPHFKLREARCKCGCGLIILRVELLEATVGMRSEFGKPIIASSWTRCDFWNEKVGGASDSYHKNGGAIDPKPVNPADLDELYAIAQRYYPFVKPYATWLHCDIRGERP